MSGFLSSISSSLPVEVLAALFLYAAGYITNEIFDLVNNKHKTALFTRRTEVAFKAIELAEKKFPEKGNGHKKLKFASHYLMANTKMRKYEAAQALILQCFPLTTLSYSQTTTMKKK